MAAATSSNSTMAADVKKIFDVLEPEYSVRAVIKCGGKTEYYNVKKTEKNPLHVEDNALTFEGTILSIQLQRNKSIIRIQRSCGPLEMAIHTETGKAYVGTEDAKVYRSHAEGSIKIKKTAKGIVEVQTGSSVCVLV